MSKERNLWCLVSSKMKYLWDAQRHEDKLTTGIPDVSYAIKGISGWIELKCIDDWPKKDIPVRVSHFTSEQKLWLFKRAFHGHAFIFLKVGKEYILIDGREAYDVGKLKKDDLIKISSLYLKRFNINEFARAISESHKKRETKVVETEE